jgi:predicted metal-binding protein
MKLPPAPDLLAAWTASARASEVELRAVSIADIVFDERTILKCRYHCPAWGQRWTCGPDTWGPPELIPLLKQYSSVLILTGYDIGQVTAQALEAERAAFAAGYPFALAVAVTLCSACEGCTYPDEACRMHQDLRPESAVAGIHTLETLSRLGIAGEPEKGWLRASFVFVG